MMIMEFLELRECTQYVHTIDIGVIECLSCWIKPPWRMRVNSALGQVGLSQVGPDQLGPVIYRPGPIRLLFS